MNRKFTKRPVCFSEKLKINSSTLVLETIQSFTYKTYLGNTNIYSQQNLVVLKIMQCQPAQFSTLYFQQRQICLLDGCLLKILLCSFLKGREQFSMLSFDQSYLDWLDYQNIIGQQCLFDESYLYVPSINNQLH